MTIHGRLSTYTRGRCRCADCREAWRVYHQQYRALKRQLGQCAKCSRPAYGSRCDVHRLKEAA